MLQFIPVDMDSLNINLPAAESMAKNYYPMFDWLGFAHLDGTTTGMTTYSDFTEFAVPYQVADPTVYEKNTGKIESLGIKTIVVDNAEMIANYVIVYKAEDKWTRVAEGSITENHDFSYELPAGNYYYQEINYIDMGIAGAAGYRTFISDGTFTVEAPNQVINQLREKIGVMFGNPETTTGGNALKFYASVRLDIRGGQAIKNGEEVIGKQTKVKVVKNKVAPPFRRAEFDIMFGEGISRAGEIIDLGAELGIIKKSGSWFSYNDTKIAQGRDAAKQVILDNPELAEELEGLIFEELKKEK
jgi:hypothetical protein